MAVSYDENVIVTFAERLYRRAATIVILCALLGCIVGAVGVELVAAAARVHSDATNGFAVLFALVAAVIGVLIGNERAFALRLLAQQALCQVQIERNTRAAMMGRLGQVPPSAMPPAMPR
jgi:predicted membrane-bound spermidine synthase